jgi:hypothetical protein
LHLGSRVPGALPKQHGGVGAPWTPRFGSTLKFPHRPDTGDATQNKSIGQKGVGISERSHRHILSYSSVNSGNFAQLLQESVAIDNSVKLDPTIANGADKSANGVGLHSVQTDASQIGVG